jgi:hypothetical protein
VTMIIKSCYTISGRDSRWAHDIGFSPTPQPAGIKFPDYCPSVTLHALPDTGHCPMVGPLPSPL